MSRIRAMKKYVPSKIEAKWQKHWEETKAWKVDLGKAKKSYYNLMMFPYPSAEGLHVGNVYAFTGSDIHGRFRRMQGKDVFEPIGFDAFGINSENFAIQQGVHPKTQTAQNIQNFRKQLKQMGALFDWDHEVDTSNPNYYKWTQWLFLQLYKAGLAYRAKAPVDWCPSCKTVLADEQVINGHCERCETTVVQKELEQWFFRITKYAEKLLKNLNRIDWSERTKVAQRNWIGKSEGLIEKWDVDGMNTALETFTTWPHTTYGATFIVVAPEHPIIRKLVAGTKYESGAEKFIRQVQRAKIKDPTSIDREKKGFFTGRYAVNFLTKEKIPVYIANFVVMGYGTGIVKGAPAHDQRDFEFAKKYNLPIKIVVCPHYPKTTCPILTEAYIGSGHMVGADQFDGMPDSEAREAIAKHSIKLGHARRKTIYHLRDWLISRQRYWGPPIPIIYCEECGIVPVPEKDLPVLLPNIKNFRPTGTSKSPLASVERFVNTKCPQCKKPAKRETDVSDTFLDSAWYFLRYPSTDFPDKPLDKVLTKKWLPIDMYIGGQEHAVLHLMYTRFTTMVLNDLGYIDFAEPFTKFRAHGLVIKEGAKMSKSRGNVVNPDEYFIKYGADTVRMYLMFIGPFTEGGDWNDKSIIGISRYLNRLWRLCHRELKDEVGLDSLRQKTIRKVTEDMEELRYNTVIAALMEYTNEIQKVDAPAKIDVETLLILLAPFAPHVTEELWENLGHKDSVHNQSWPKYNPRLVKEATIRLVLQVNGKVRDVREVASGISEKEAKELALESEKVQKWVKGKKPKRVVVVPKKLVNIVI